MASDDRDLKGDSFAIGHIVLDLREATRFGNNLQRYLLFILKKAELFIQDRSLQSLEWINLTDGLKLNGATSAPMSILRALPVSEKEGWRRGKNDRLRKTNYLTICSLAYELRVHISS